MRRYYAEANVEICGLSKIGWATYIGDGTVIGAPLPETIRGEKENEGCEIGRCCIIRQYNVFVETCKIGNRVHTGPFVEIREKSVVNDGSRLHVGTEVMHDAYVGRRVRTAEYAMIGEYAFVSDDCFIGPHTVFAPDVRMTNECSQIRIGRGVRIGAHVTVVGGVEIGEGALIGGHSLVNKNIPPFTVAYGTPAKPSRKLTLQEVTEYNNVLEEKWGKQEKSLIDLYTELVK